MNICVTVQALLLLWHTDPSLLQLQLLRPCPQPLLLLLLLL
jgi:hypothetical protein